MRRKIESSQKKKVNIICGTDDSLKTVEPPRLKSLEKADIHPGVVFSGGCDSIVVHCLTQEVLGDHELLCMDFGGAYSRETENAKKFNPTMFETDWRRKYPPEIKSVSPFNIPFVLCKYLSNTNCFFGGVTLEATMFGYRMGNMLETENELDWRMYQPLGSLFDPAIVKLLMDFQDENGIVECATQCARPETEKSQRKKMLFNIAMDRYGYGYKRFEIQSPKTKCNTMGVSHGLITVMYLLKHLPREQVELVYDLSQVPNEVFDIIENYKLTFFDRYSPLYLDEMAEKYFITAFENHGVLKYDENDMKEYKNICQLIKRLTRK